MASVTFPPALGGDGSTVTDDSNPTTGLANGGHRARFVPALSQTVAVMQGGVAQAQQKVTDAAAQVTLAANQVTLATSQATAAGNSAAAAANSQANALSSANSAAASFDQFDDRYLGSKTTDPTLDNDGNSLITGAMYFNSSFNEMRVRTSGGTWAAAYLPAGGFATLNGTETLTNKTLTTPVLSGTASGTTAGRLGYLSGDLTYGTGSVQRTAVNTDEAQTLTNKTLTSPVITQNIQVISTNTTAVRSRTYVLTASLTLTLPASPAAGDWVAFSNRSSTTTPVIARNGQNIMGLAEDMTLNNVNAAGLLTFADATRGWVLS